MRKRMIGIVAMALALIVISPHVLQASSIPKAKELLSVVPQASSFERTLRPLDHYRMKDRAGHFVGVAFVTSAIPPAVVGYRGEIDVLVGMAMDGTITGARVLGHGETPAFIERIERAGLLDQLVGMNAKTGLSDVEAISGATLSSQAILDDVRTASGAVFALLSEDAALKASGEGWFSKTSPIVKALLLMPLLCLALVAAYQPSRRKLRVLSLFAGVLIIGVWMNTPITIGNFVDLRNLAFSWKANPALALLLLFALVMAFIKGNLYCSLLCPFGALQIGAGKLLSRKLTPDKRVIRAASWLRWIMAIVTVYAIAALGSEAFRTVEPFSLLFSRSPVWGTIVQAAVILIVALFVPRIWCRYFCPSGLLLDLSARIGCKVRRFMRGKRGNIDEPCSPA